jgi:hypothetical protein
MTYSSMKKFIIFGWTSFLAVVICREIPDLREAMVGTFSIVVAFCIAAFVASSLTFFTFVDNIHQKLGDFIEFAEQTKFNGVQNVLTKLKREIIENMLFFIFLGLFIILVKGFNSSILIYFVQTTSILLLLFTAVDQARAAYTSIELRREVIRKK